jgi:peptidase E
MGPAALIIVAVAMLFSSEARALSSSNCVFLSRFSGLDPLRLRNAMEKTLRPAKTLDSTSRLVYLPTASFVYSSTSEKPKGEQRRRMRYEARAKAFLLAQGLGLDTTEKPLVLELDAPKLQQEDIRKVLTDAEVLYVEGGNTFYLHWVMLKTGFWDVAAPLLDSGKLVYMGASAGAIVAGTSIETAFWKGWDAPILPDMGMDDCVWNAENLRGRSLVDFSLFMHYSEPEHAALVQNKKDTLPLVCVRDDSAILISAGAALELKGDGTIAPISLA